MTTHAPVVSYKCEKRTCSVCYQTKLQQMPSGQRQDFEELFGPPTCQSFCEDEECMYCGALSCPDFEPLHLHHDGCPACINKGRQTIVVEHQSDPAVVIFRDVFRKEDGTEV